MQATLDVRRASDRATTSIDWLESHHSFNFGPHHQVNNDGHGLLLVSNDDIVVGGGGFGMHGHRDMEIVTWVLDGELEHRDSTGTHGVIYPGLAQRMSAGSGIRHSEHNASATEPVRFVQMWVVPDEVGLEPSYEQRDMNAALDAGGLVPVASGKGHPNAISLNQRGAAFWVGRFDEGDTFELPDARFVHLYVARGHLGFDATCLTQGDATRFTNAGSVTMQVRAASEVLVWESDDEVQR